MSAVRKLVIAAALVATGLGVAFLLGRPAAVQQTLKPSLPVWQSATVASSPAAESGKTVASMPPRVQLLPETPAASPSQSALEAPPLVSSLVPVAAAASGVTSMDAIPASNKLTPNNTNCSPPRRFDEGIAVAKLRNEAPRALGNEPRSPAEIRRLPPVADANPQFAESGANRVNNVGADWSGSRTIQAGGITSLEEPSSPPATAAAYSAPAASAPGQLAPSPWPMAEPQNEPRTHIVADGDSLERLASLYLSDPQRSREIYELNRDVLGNPDLLPIGAELKIPERVANNTWNRQGRLSEPAEINSVHAASRSNLVPIRPVQPVVPYEVAPPRAELARPIPIE